METRAHRPGNEIEIKGRADKSAIVGALSRRRPTAILTIARPSRFGLSSTRWRTPEVRAVVSAPDRAARDDRGGGPGQGHCQWDPKGLLDLKKKGFRR